MATTTSSSAREHTDCWHNKAKMHLAPSGGVLFACSPAIKLGFIALRVKCKMQNVKCKIKGYRCVRTIQRRGAHCTSAKERTTDGRPYGFVRCLQIGVWRGGAFHVGRGLAPAVTTEKPLFPAAPRRRPTGFRAAAPPPNIPINQNLKGGA